MVACAVGAEGRALKHTLRAPPLLPLLLLLWACWACWLLQGANLPRLVTRNIATRLHCPGWPLWQVEGRTVLLCTVSRWD